MAFASHSIRWPLRVSTAPSSSTTPKKTATFSSIPTPPAQSGAANRLRTAKGVDSEIPRPAQRGEGGAKRRVRGAALACILLTTPALAHSVVAADRNNDNGLGLAVK